MRHLVTLALSVALAGCSLFQAPVKPPDIRLRGIAVESVAPRQQVFLARLQIDNPNAGKLRISGGRLQLMLEDLLIGEGELVEAFSIPGEASGSADVRIVTDLVSHGPQLLQWILAGRREVDYRLSGYIDPAAFGLGRMRIEESGNLSMADLQRLLQRTRVQPVL